MKTVDRVTALALRLKPGEVLLNLVMAPFLALGWLLYWVLWTPLAFLIAAGQYGWQMAKAQRQRMQVAARERESQ